MWHELVLHGIGGRTIAEAKANLSWVEAQWWLAFIRKRGTLNWGTRIEQGFALLAWILANKVSGYDAKGKPVGVLKKPDGKLYTVRDFMPHADAPVDEDRDENGELTLEGVMRKLTGGK